MKRITQTLLIAPIACAAFGASFSAAAADSGAMMVSDCWIRALPGNLPSGAYFSMMNMGDKAIDLTGVQAPAFGMAMLHQSQSNGSMSKMVMVDKVSVPAGQTVAFAPGGYHVMLEQPKTALKVGTTQPITFLFSDGEQLTEQCAVKSAGASGN
jgi:periplasmic copper chaperone A